MSDVVVDVFSNALHCVMSGSEMRPDNVCRAGCASIHPLDFWEARETNGEIREGWQLKGGP